MPVLMDIANEKLLLHRDSAATIFDTWTEYVKGDNLFTNNVEGRSRRLQEEKKRLFAPEKEMQVDVLNILNNSDTHGMQTRCRTVYNCSDLDEYLLHNNDFHTRYISVAALNSIKPLKITEAGMHTILNHHNVGPQFLDLLLSFATRKLESEAGPGNLMIKNYPNSSYELQYRFSYSEEIVGCKSRMWAIRQTGVYHRHVPNGSGNLWILLHSRPESTIQKRLEECALEWEGRNGSLDEWEMTHILILSSYFDDWRWYLKSLSAEVETLAGTAISYDFPMTENHRKGTDILQHLHALLNKIMPITPRLRSTLATVTALKTLYETLRGKTLCTERHAIRILDELRAYETYSQGHLATVTLLEKKVQETVGLLAVALNLRGQSTALLINKNIFSLTKDTVDDSATVCVVTAVTLVYLPASFVTSLFGMNLFTFQTSPGSGFQVSKQFWVFLLITVPLTFLTVGSWKLVVRRRKQKKLERERQALVGGESEDA